MKATRALIILGTLLVTAGQLAQAQQATIRAHSPHPPASVAGDLMATDEVIGDSMVLPLLGMSDHIDGRLAFVRTELKITPSQLALWNAFAAAARANAAEENAMLQESEPIGNDVATPSLPQRLQAHERHLTAHLRMLQTITAALLPLYDSFSDEQKKVVDGLVNGAAGL